MDLVLVLVTSAVFPVVCLGFVLWMGRIEDAIPGSVARSVRRPDPAPVLRIPVRRPAAEARIPGQRAPAPAAVAPAPTPAAVPTAPAAPAGT